MTRVFVGSSNAFAGKTLVCLILGLKLKEEGRAVGYFKPVGGLPTRVEGYVVDEDAAFVREVLQLPDALHDVSPFIAGSDLYRRAMSGDIADEISHFVEEAFGRVSAGRDVMLVAGHGSVPVTGKAFGLDARRLTDALDCRVLLVGRYESESSLDGIFASRDLLGERLAGVLLNDVLADDMTLIRETIAPYLERSGVPVFGALPHDPVLKSVSVGELAEHLHAEMLCCPDRLTELVQHFVVGAMNVESALRYFRRMPGRAVITGGDRADIQLAALETASKCIILTGGLRPSAAVVSRSQEMHIPLLLSRDDTMTVVDRIEWLMERARIREQPKILRATELAREHIDFVALWKALGL